MTDGIDRISDLASGLTRSTFDRTEKLLAQFVRQGEVAADHAERLLDQVIARSVEGGGALAQLVRTEVERAVAQAGVARTEDVAVTRRDVDALRGDVTDLRGDVMTLRGEVTGLRAAQAARDADLAAHRELGHPTVDRAADDADVR